MNTKTLLIGSLIASMGYTLSSQNLPDRQTRLAQEERTRRIQDSLLGARLGDSTKLLAKKDYVIENFVTNSDPRLDDSRIPTGWAGGDLSGIYPNPAIKPDVTLYGNPVVSGSGLRITSASQGLTSERLQFGPDDGSYIEQQRGPGSPALGIVTASLYLVGSNGIYLNSPNVNIVNPPATSDNSLKVATTSYVKSNLANYVTTSDSRLTNSRTPTGSAGGDLSGTYPNPTIKRSVTLQGNPTVTGNLRLKGSGNYGNKLNLGDGEYVYLHEETDDNLTIKAKNINLTPTTAVTAPTPATSDKSTKVATTAYVHSTNIFDNPNIFYVVYDGGIICKSSNIISVEPMSAAGQFNYFVIKLSNSINVDKLIPMISPLTAGTDPAANYPTVKYVQSSLVNTDRLMVFIKEYTGSGTQRGYDSFSFFGFLVP